MQYVPNPIAGIQRAAVALEKSALVTRADLLASAPADIPVLVYVGAPAAYVDTLYVDPPDHTTWGKALQVRNSCACQAPG
jgi:hypothetical protein